MDALHFAEMRGYFFILAACFVVNLVLRTVWALIARYFGFWHPAYDALWPRLPWRPVWLGWVRFREWWHDLFTIGKGHTAGWASVFTALSLQYREGDVLIGRVRHWFGGWIQPMGLPNVQRHLVMIAGAGSGKTSFMITMLALLKVTQSAFIIDPKGEIARALIGAARARGRKVHVLDPLGITPFETDRWNYLAEIPVICARLGQDVTTLYLDKIAQAEIQKSEKENPFWPDSARIVWASILALVYLTEPLARRNPVRARELINHGYREHAHTPQEAFQLLWLVMKDTPDFGGYIAKGGAIMAGADERTADNILASIRSSTAYLDHPQVRRVVERSTMNLTDLKGGSDFVIPVAPTTEIRGTLSPYFRVLTMVSLWIFEQIPGGLKDPTFFALDEFPSLGYNPDIEAAAPVMRGYGVRLAVIAQDIEALRRVYPNSWGGFLGNAEAVIYMGCGHPQTAEHLSKTLGQRTLKEKNSGLRHTGHVKRERDLMTPDQCMRFLAPRKRNMVITRFGERPVRAKMMPYWQDLPTWLYEPSDHYGDAPGRAWFRQYRQQHVRSEARPAPEMSEAQARAVFGLTGHFTQRDLVERCKLLEHRFPTELIHSALKTLERRL